MNVADVAPTVTNNDPSYAESTSCSAAVVDLANSGVQSSITWTIASGNEDGDGDGTTAVA